MFNLKLLSIKNWSYAGNKLARPDLILRRVLAWPILHILHLLTSACVLFGWGYVDGRGYLTTKGPFNV